MKSRTWIVLFLITTIVPLIISAVAIYYIDPYFHYHKPHTDKFFYTIDNERSQNDGIIKHFDYEGLITGTSMCQNFKTSEAEHLFGVRFVKVPFAGGSFKEVNDAIITALNANDNLEIIIRGIDIGKIIQDKDTMRYDLGEYPQYLYDSDPLNDVKYLFNKDILIRAFRMFVFGIKGNDNGITSFDVYSNWMKKFSFGVKSKYLYPQDVPRIDGNVSQDSLTEYEQQIVNENVEQNIIKTARERPDVTFYYFFTPYSAAWWYKRYQEGNYKKQIEAERIAIEKMLEVDNIKLYSINNRFDLTTDLNNYKDDYHYGEWINSLLLRYMHDGKYQLTKDNYGEYLANEEAFYNSFDYYSEFANQEDYKDDYYAAELLYAEIYMD